MNTHRSVCTPEDFHDVTDEVCGATGWEEIDAYYRLLDFLKDKELLQEAADYLRNRADKDD